jgi:hypothetical protein
VKLTDLNPRWAIDGEILVGGQKIVNYDRHGMAVSFDCPCCGGTSRATRLTVFLANPIDGGLPSDDGKLWTRSGDTFETLTLSPSVDVSEYKHWHGHITGGEIR